MSGESGVRRPPWCVGRARMAMGWILLFVWLAWVFQPASSLMVTAASSSGLAEKNGKTELAQQESEESPPRIERGLVRGDMREDLDSSADDPVVLLKSLPGHLAPILLQRVVPNINNALVAEGRAALDPGAIKMSAVQAEAIIREYEAIWDTGLVYDNIMEERVKVLMAAGAPGTGLIDVSGWPVVNDRLVREEIARRMGRPGGLPRGGATLLRWEREASGVVRYGVFLPGDDKVIDSAKEAEQSNIRGPIRFGLIRLAGKLQEK